MTGSTRRESQILMTIDDESSVYVGGLPYDATEDSVRSVFDFYGAVVAVKIINDPSTRGKCYGFVTFRNPRSAIDAINDMDGRTIDGRVVRVNEVKTRGGGRLNFSRERESFRRNVERGRNWDRGGRDHEREYDIRDRERYRDRSSDRSRERDRDLSLEHHQERDRGYERERDHDQVRDQGRDRGYQRGRDHDQRRDHFMDRERDQDGDLEVDAQQHSRNHDQGWERDHHTLDPDRDREMDRTNIHNNIVEKDKDEQSRRWNGPKSIDRQSREPLPHANDDYNDQVKEQLERSLQRLEELKNETSQMEERLKDEGKLVMDLQKKSKKLEDALINAKKSSSHHKMQLTKLHKCFMQVRDYTERLKSCEQELQQSVFDTTMLEDGVDDVA